MGRSRVLTLAACAAVAVAAVIASVAGAGNRTAVVTFTGVPGPARVTAGQNIAYTATFKNTGRSTFTHVEFHMTIPTATSGSSSYPATLVSASCPAVIVDGELVCDLGKVKSGSPPVQVSVVWQSPQAPACDGCLTSTGRWLIKERDNDSRKNDDNDTFPAGTVATTILAQDDPREAAGFATSACTDPTGAGTLSTDPDVDPSEPVSTTICLPVFATTTIKQGVATGILEGPAAAGDPGHTALGRSNVCVASFGQACGPDGTYTPFDFGTATPIQFLFRISGAALAWGEKITTVYHNGVALPSCPSTNPNGCVVSITPPSKYSTRGHSPSGGKGVWKVVAKAPTNGPWNW